MLIKQITDMHQAIALSTISRVREKQMLESKKSSMVSIQRIL